MKYPPNHFLGAQRNGLNHVGMNMGDFNRVSGPVRGTNYPIYSDALLNWYQTKNVKSVRLMFTWEAVQRTLGGPVPATVAGPGYADYWADLISVLTRLLARDIYVILSPWQYNSNSGDTDIVYDDAAFTPGNFADFWGKFAAAINGVTGNDQRVAFDLINEPHTHAESGNKLGDIGISLTDWFTCAQDAINVIRAAGATNTIFVPGMAYTAASSFTTNGSSAAWLKHPVTNLPLKDSQKNIAVTVHCYTGLGSASPTVLRDACSALVTWARTNGIKVNIGEIAIDAGPNGRPNFCSTLTIAQEQWKDWNKFCVANNDVVVGWNWWANSAGIAAGNWWNQGDSCDSNGFHWGLTLNDGATQTIYMDLIEATLPVPKLDIRDNVADTGSEPNNTTARAWESPDVWVRKSADGIEVGEDILGGGLNFVYVKVTNNGKGPYPSYPSGGGHIVRLYWAKAETGLNWPTPWNEIIPPRPIIGPILPGKSETVTFPWPNTPNPVGNAPNDGHFCLLAFVTRATSLDLEGFPKGGDLNDSVLGFSNVAWRNIHIVHTAPQMKMGNMVVSNHRDRDMLAQISFEILDAAARPIDPAGVRLLITARGAALEKLHEYQDDRPFLEDLGHGSFLVLDVATGIPHLDLRPEEVLPFGLEYVPDQESKGYVVRATQFSLEGASRKTIGGQTFVAGEVEGVTTRSEPRRRRSWWPWVAVSVLLLLLIALLVKGRKKKVD
jgi:hypothetical protein